MSTIEYQTEEILEQPGGRKSRKWLKRTGIAAAVAGAAIVGSVVGSASYQDELAAAQADFDERVAESRSQADAAIAEAEAELQAQYDERAAALDERETAVAEAEGAVAEREAAVAQTEQAIDASKIAPGMYLVPDEVAPGRYRAMEDVTGDYCYMSQNRGDEIIDNMLENAGRPIFTVQNIPGTTVKFEDCGTVQKID